MAIPAAATQPTKGAGTQLWRQVEGATITTDADYLDETKWEVMGKLKELTPNEMTVEEFDDAYLDDENPDWKNTEPGEKDAGEFSFTLAWMPGDPAQKAMVEELGGAKKHWRVTYPNGAVDGVYGYVSSIGKAIPKKETMTRTAKIRCSGKPALGETLLTLPVGP